MFHDPLPEEPAEFIEAVHDFFLYTHKLLFSFPWFKLMNTPAWKKFCKAQDTAIGIGQRYVDRKLTEIQETDGQPENIINQKGLGYISL